MVFHPRYESPLTQQSIPVRVYVKRPLSERAVTASKGSTLGDRVFALRQALGSVRRPLSMGDMAALLTKKLKRSPPFSASTIQRWETGIHEPDIETLRVLAELAGVSFESFVLGDKAKPLDGYIDPAKDRRLTDEEIARARAQVAARDAAKVPAKRGKRA